MATDVYNETKVPELLGGTISLQILSTIIVILRFASRKVAKAGFWWDDWTIIPALIFDWGISACSWYQVQHSGFGRHTEEAGGPVTPSQIELFFKVHEPSKPLPETNQRPHGFTLGFTPSRCPVHAHRSYALQIFYFLSSVFFKASLILLYWRIFGVSRGFRKVLIVAWSIVIMYFVANLLAAIFECNPIAKYWNMGLSGKCVDTVAFYRWNGVANLLIDFMILTLTLPMVWQLSLKLQQKVVITGLFLLGCFVVIAPIIRVTTFASVIPTDITYTLVTSSTWSTVEQSTGIICACLPVLAPLFRTLLGHSATSRHRGSTPYAPYKKSSEGSIPIKMRIGRGKYGVGDVSTVGKGEGDSTQGFTRLDEEWGGGVGRPERLAVPREGVVRTEVGRGNIDDRAAMPGSPKAIKMDQTVEQTTDLR